VKLENIADGVHYLALRGVNVFFVQSGESWSLIDCGWANQAEPIRRAAESLYGINSRPASILLTHAHPDHAGSAKALAIFWDVPVYVHPDELAIAGGELAAITRHASPLDRYLVLPLLRLLGRKRREAIMADSSLQGVVQAFDPDDGVPGLPDWECIPTPGHTPGHCAYFRRRDRVLIAGDAVLTAPWGGLLTAWQRLSLPPYLSSWDWRQSRASIDLLARLEPRVLATGHGMPMYGEKLAQRLLPLSESHTGS